MTSALLILATIFVEPIALPSTWRFWMMFPLVACVALVYRATRARTAGELLWPTVVNFVQIIVGMALIAAAFYAAHWAAIRYL
jgi:hypothetical protein